MVLIALQNISCVRTYSKTSSMSKKQLSAAKALEAILADVDPADSEGEDVNVELDSDFDSETDQLSDEEDSPPPQKKSCVQPVDEEDGPPPQKKSCVETGLTETAKDGTVWHEVKLGAPTNFTPIDAYAADGEPTSMARRRITSRLQSFLCLVTLEMLGSIQHATVQHAKLENDDWFVSISELMTFIAIVILRGVIKVPAVGDYWSESFRQFQIADKMSRNRFQSIMRHLRFDNMSTRKERAKTDRFAAISELWGSFVSNCISSYNPGRHITVDEQLFPSKTRCCFLQYIATKPDKFGIKFWAACDLSTKYICNVLPYLGKDPSRPKGERLSESVVMRLMEPFLDMGRNVTTDNFFTSLALARRLNSRRTTILGTVNKIRRELPQSAKQADQNHQSIRVFSTTDATLTVFRPKPRKTVCIFSSMHSMVDIDISYKMKPNTIKDYNTSKCGVDIMDQMVREYSVRKGTRRWPVAVFYNMIDMAALNAHVLYQACTGNKERRATFLMELANELASRHLAGKNAQKEQQHQELHQQPHQQPATPSPAKRARCQIRHDCKGNSASKTCAECNKYACGQCAKQKQWLCYYCDLGL